LAGFVAEHEQYAAVAEKAAEVIESGSESDLQLMLDRYGPGRVMFRNSRRAVCGFPKRIPHLVSLEPAASGCGSPRTAWLADFLKHNPDRKVLVICATAVDVMELENELRMRVGIDIAGFHENMTLLQCDRQAAWFAEPDGACVLITSGMGGEGRNYQFASHMVLMDLPEDPELVEQRIGRLDRIGQAHDVHIHVPYIKGSEMEGRVRWLNEGLDAFSSPLVGGYRMYLKFGDHLDAVTDDLIDETRRLHQELCREIERGRDRLLELSSCREEVAAELVESIRNEERDRTLEQYMLEVFEQFGVDAEPLGGRNYLLSADFLFCEEFPLPREGGAMQITFDREYALSRPVITLLSWDHPMVQGAMDLVLGSERGACAIARSNSIDCTVLQAVYLLEVVSPQRMEIERFMPPTPIVVQVNDRLVEVIDAVNVNGDGESWWLGDDAQLRQVTLPAMVAATRRMAEDAVPSIIRDAGDMMRLELGAELERMRELSMVNDHIRQEELDVAEKQVSEFADAIRQARLRLDSLRLIMPG
jgi:ATP-dependent helicase HepA